MKRGLACTLVLVLGFVVVTGCGGGGGAKVETAGQDSIYAKAQSGSAAEVIAAIRDDGFDANRPDENGKTLMHYAVLGNRPDLVADLLEVGHADPRIKDNEGKTPLDVAQAQKNGKIVRILGRYK